MASNTPFLDLFKRDPLTEPTALFNIKEMMNDNWDKIDAAFDADPDAAGVPQLSFVPMFRLGKYTGTGGHGASHSRVIDGIGFCPVYVLITESAISRNNGSLRLFRTMPSDGSYHIEWGSDSVMWYATNASYDWEQFNTANVTYHYVVIGYRSESV